LLSFFIKITSWIAQLNRDSREESKFIDLAPTDKADKAGVYSAALMYATSNPRVSNIALTGPYGSGKSSIIRAFLKKYKRPFLQISLAAFLPEAISAGGHVSKQEIERSILQQMLYGADANKLPLSRFKRIQSPSRWSILVSLYIIFGLFACWHIFQERYKVLSGDYFIPLDINNWFNIICFVVGLTFLWQALHRIYVKSLGVSLKSISLKDIEITPVAASQESILNRHLDEIIYFFQSTKYDLVIIEDLDRFDNQDIFVTLREINSIVNENAGVKRIIRFLYALRDNMFVNTDRTKFFEFIIPVIPIINSSNSIDMVLEQGKRLSLDERLDRQFLREVSRYLDDLRLIQNIFNEYVVYVANLETDGECVLDANKLLAVLIYKNVFPGDFEKLHRGKGNLANILNRHDEYIAKSEADYKSQISHLEEQIDISEKQTPADLKELRKIYSMALIEKLPHGIAQIGLDGSNFVPIQDLSRHEQFDQLIEAPQVIWRSTQGHQQRISVAGFQAEVNPAKSFQRRKSEIERKSDEFRTDAAKTVRELRAKISALRTARFNEVIRQNARGVDELFDAFGDNGELARFLIFEGFLDDTYYQYTSLFHSGRLSPNDNKFLIRIRSFINPEPDFQIDNPKEVVAAMRGEDFHQNYVLNTKIVDCLLGEPARYGIQISKLFEFIASDFDECDAFFSTYYERGENVSALISGLVEKWPGFVLSAIANGKNLSHITHIIAHLPEHKLKELPGRYPSISAFVSVNLARILALGIDFDPARLKQLQIEATDLPSIAPYPGVCRLLAEEGLYELSIENLEFIFQSILGLTDLPRLRRSHYSTILKTGNAALMSKVEGNFGSYLENVLLKLDENSEEDVSAVLAAIDHDEIDIEYLEGFLEKQTAVLPSLDEAPPRFHSLLLQLQKIEASWDNCQAFLSSENYDAEILTAYLDNDDTLAALSQIPMSDSDKALSLRQFLIGNDDLRDESYRTYVRGLPKPFAKFPADLSVEKLQVIIEEKKISFNNENFLFLGDHSDLQILFVAKHIDLYLKNDGRIVLDDDFRERLLNSDIRDDHRLKIIGSMDLTLLSSLPSRAAMIGSILNRTGADISGIDAECVRAIIVNSKPIAVQISLFNRMAKMLDKGQVREIIKMLPKPFSEITTGWNKPRIESTRENIEFVKWMHDRRFISSWSESKMFDKIRINLYRS